MRRHKSTAVTVVALVALSVLAGDLRAASPKERLREKRAQAEAVLTEVNALDRRFEASVEAWNGARYELAATRKELATERGRLRVAEQERRIAVARVRARLVAIYESPTDTSAAAAIFGATSISQIIDRLEAANTIAAADEKLAADTTRARDRYELVAKRTAALERSREEAVARREAERRQIGAMLAQRKRLLAGIQSEVATLQAEEARRQALLAAQARARLAAQQAELRRQAAERARAADAARRAAARQAETTTTQPTTTAPAAVTTTTTAATTTSAAPAPLPSPPATGGHPEAATIALRYLGVPYVWGGASPSGFDCSGLVMYVYAQLGISLPHFAAAQYGMGTPVSRDQLQPGDLVFFDGLNHVGIYIGGGQFVHAPETGDVVKITPLSSFGPAYVGARRI